MSEARNCGVEGVIGKFGSGTKHAINLLLRKGIEFHIYAGRTRLEFYYEIERVQTAHGVTETPRVKCRLTGDRNRTIDCGWVLDFGAMDWTETHMALREFVSNAIDCSKLNGSRDGLEVRPEANRRARADHTRIFVSMHGEGVQDFYNRLGFYFLHFSGKPDQVRQRFLDKNPEHTGPIIYREGVFVRALQSSTPAAFDYNFLDSEIKIDECRNSSEYTLRAAIGMAVNRASSETLEKLFDRVAQGEVYEGSLDEYYLGYDSNSAGNWKAAWNRYAGEAVAVSEVNPMSEYVQRKGHTIKLLKSANLVKVAGRFGVRTVSNVLGKHAGAGKVPVPTTTEAQNAVDTVWSWCEVVGMTNGKGKPEVACFKQLMDSEGECLGYFDGKVHIREDLAGKIALKTAIEEVAHYITGATDNSRDFQNFAFDMIVELAI
jgi:hypothetical protein